MLEKGPQEFGARKSAGLGFATIALDIAEGGDLAGFVSSITFAESASPSEPEPSLSDSVDACDCIRHQRGELTHYLGFESGFGHFTGISGA